MYYHAFDRIQTSLTPTKTMMTFAEAKKPTYPVNQTITPPLDGEKGGEKKEESFLYKSHHFR